MSRSEEYKIEWFGHCAFRVSYKGNSFLFDPYDSFQNIRIGKIDADYLLISSTWHDHGNINASPKAHIISYEGEYDFNKGFKIYGIKTAESRGSQNIIFTIVWNDGMSITNFADWGDLNGREKLSSEELEILSQSKIGLMRINYIDLENQFYCYDLALSVSKPSIIIPIHYYPKAFINRAIPENRQEGYVNKLEQVKNMHNRVKYQYEQIAGFEYSEKKLPKNNTFLEFTDIHPQVVYQG